MNIKERLAQYSPVHLEADLAGLSEVEHQILALFIEAAQPMDGGYWKQCCDDHDYLFNSAADEDTKRLLRFNYGPWDRIQNDEPFIQGVGTKPAGANFYPPDMTEQEFEHAAAAQPQLNSPFTMVRRDDKGNLLALLYHRFFQEQTLLAADKLRQAAVLAGEPTQKKYLSLRADALLSDDYRHSDLAWMDMRDNTVDILIGPMETSADRLLWTKAAYASSVLVKDKNWSGQLSQYLRLLPLFQENLPVPPEYRREHPGLDSDLQVYDAVYCAGYDRASLPLGINWPNDEEVRAIKGTRSLQIKNLMQVKFERLLAPLTSLLVATDQQASVTFDAFFTFILFHEIAHGLGIKHTISGKGLVRAALDKYDFVIEEAKADLLGLFTISNLHRGGYLTESQIRDIYVTSLLDIFRRNGHSRQGTLRLNFFKEMGAYSRDARAGTYRVQMDRAPAATHALTEKLLRFQGDGDYEGVQAFLDRYGQPDDDMLRDLERIAATGLPLEIAIED